MSIKSELTKTASYLRSARKAILGRGGEISLTAGLKDLPEAIYKIPADASLAYQSDDGVAYQKLVPDGAEEFAQVSKIGGMSYKAENLFSVENLDGATINEDGSITVSIPANSTLEAYGFLEDVFVRDKQYYFSSKDTIPGGVDCYICCEVWNYDDGASELVECRAGEILSIPENTGNIELCIETLDTVDYDREFTLNLAIREYEGIRDTKATELVSEGANRFNPFDEPKSVLSSSVETLEDGSWKVTTTRTGTSGIFCYALSKPIYVQGDSVYVKANATPINKVAKWNILVTLRDKDGTNLKRVTISSNTTSVAINNIKTSYPNAEYIDLTLYSVMGEECDVGDGFIYSNVIVSFDADVPYTPYKGVIDTFTIPEEIQAIKGYGQSNPDNAEEYNYTDFVNKKQVTFGYVDDNGLWVKYDTPIETDISAYLPADITFIVVEGGGIIMVVNKYKYDVPSTINYIIKTEGA